jgi:hypothetical protein
MTRICNNILHSKVLLNMPKLVFLVWKNIWQPCFWPSHREKEKVIQCQLYFFFSKLKLKRNSLRVMWVLPKKTTYPTSDQFYETVFFDQKIFWTHFILHNTIEINHNYVINLLDLAALNCHTYLNTYNWIIACILRSKKNNKTTPSEVRTDGHSRQSPRVSRLPLP